MLLLLKKALQFYFSAEEQTQLMRSKSRRMDTNIDHTKAGFVLNFLFLEKKNYTSNMHH